MAKLIPFRTRRQQRADYAAYVLALSTRLEHFSKTKPWTRPREDPERLGNLLQQLAHERPAVLFVIEQIVADLVAELAS